MTTRELRRLMTVDLEAAASEAAGRNEQLAMTTLRELVRLEVLVARDPIPGTVWERKRGKLIAIYDELYGHTRWIPLGPLR